MCQLLGMTANTPTDICFSFTGLHARGGLTDKHRDGWGIAFFEGTGTRLFLDTKAAVESPIADVVRRMPIHAKNVIAHIRLATRGHVALENTHPFQREFWGRYWVFAHNGTLANVDRVIQEQTADFMPVGQTDSEAALCWMLSQLRARFGAQEPARAVLFEAIAALTRELAVCGEFNFLLSNGEWLMAHASSRLSYVIRRAPFATAHLVDRDVTVDFNTLAGPADCVAVIATVPLTDNESWTVIPPGTLKLFVDGEAVADAPTLAFKKDAPCSA